MNDPSKVVAVAIMTTIAILSVFVFIYGLSRLVGIDVYKVSSFVFGFYVCDRIYKSVKKYADEND